MTKAAWLLSGLALLAGCRAEVADAGGPDWGASSEAAIVEGTPDALGVVGLLNATTTTLYVLDELVPLNRKAAENLIAHRNGPDGILGTADDDRFDDVAEVDAVPYVGPAALASLLAYAELKGFVPQDGDLLGVYDNVAFTVNEANATLDFANSAEPQILDEAVGLDKRAVDSILAARPLQSMPHLASLYFVGHSAMLKLREYPKTLPPPAPTGTTANGMDCHAHEECQSGLCAGLTLPYYSNGFCMEAWTANTFTSAAPMSIPDDASSASSAIVVSGLATVPMDVVVDLEIDHPRKQDLRVVLHQPGGAEAVLWNHQEAPPTHIVAPSGIEGDNMVNGEWSLEITDTVSGQAGTLKSWKMWISSNWD
ncbi:MAG: proprotein convertase P-domain-containing protein [Polyangiaceae bacterium]